MMGGLRSADAAPILVARVRTGPVPDVPHRRRRTPGAEVAEMVVPALGDGFGGPERAQQAHYRRPARQPCAGAIS